MPGAGHAAVKSHAGALPPWSSQSNHDIVVWVCLPVVSFPHMFTPAELGDCYRHFGPCLLSCVLGLGIHVPVLSFMWLTKVPLEPSKRLGVAPVAGLFPRHGIGSLAVFPD